MRNHFTAIVHRDGSLFELDGRKSTPINCGPTTAATFLKDALAQVQKRFVQVCKEGEQFVLFALAPAGGGAGAAAAGGGVLVVVGTVVAALVVPSFVRYRITRSPPGPLVGGGVHEG